MEQMKVSKSVACLERVWVFVTLLRLVQALVWLMALQLVECLASQMVLRWVSLSPCLMLQSMSVRVSGCQMG